ncbi:MAG: BREX-1 system adenine-specific DNA-methyltransferase PglX [Blastocatellia bacterium]|nr:BREX-1 system adenine-specific DNA-methyltransferase PglX [Blastocatellia bacterium]
MQRTAFITHREPKDPRELKILDPACGSGHFLLYCFDLLETIYREAWEDDTIAAGLQKDYATRAEFERDIPALILSRNLHGIDIDLRATQIAALALWLRAQRAFQEMGLKENRPQITRMNLVCAEPMPGEADLLEEFIADLSPHVLGGLIGELIRNVFERMKLAGEAGALVRIEDDISGPIEEARKQWQEMLREQAAREEQLAREGALFDYRKEEAQQKLIFDVADITSEKVWQDAEAQTLGALREYARRASNGRGLLRQLFAEDAEQGFAFIDLCRQKFDVVLMNPPFGDASLPSKPYIDETYGDTKGDVYKAFVECFQDRLVPGGFLGIISSRTGFFLSGSSDWRERIVLRLYRPLVLADFGMGVLDAMVETAAYVLRSLTSEEDRQLTLQLAQDLPQVPTDKKDIFSTKKYETTRSLKRHQADSELRRLDDAGFIKPVEGRFPRWSRLDGEIAKAPAPTNAPYSSLVCLRLLGEEDKGQALYESLHNEHDARRFVVEPEDFKQVPNTPFCYWVSNDIRRVFSKLPSFESGGRVVRQGLATADDFRFVRAWWEVLPNMICPLSAHPKQPMGAYCVTSGHQWFPFAHGGAASSFYSDLHLVINWRNDGDELKSWAGTLYGGSHWSRIIKNTDLYFRPGLTWSLRARRYSPRVLFAGSVFSVRGYGIFSNDVSSLPMLLGLGNTIAFDYLFKVLLGRFEFPEFVVGTLQQLPLPKKLVDGSNESELAGLALDCTELKRTIDTTNETSHVFHLPALLQEGGNTLSERIAAWQSRLAEAEEQLAAHQREIDDIAFRLYGISDEDRLAIESSFTQTAPTADDDEQDETDDEADDETEPDQPTTDHRPLTTDLLSYAVGCAFGRWDARFATGEHAAPELPDPFAPLPVCAPAALTGEDGLPLNETPPGYPLRIDWDGILVDDPDHEDDIIRRVRDVFELLWQERAEEIEREACELLGVKELRDYFRKPGNDGFWMQHVKRYSKSRRKAPIYWLLQSPKKGYSLWLYYHRLDKDILFKALVNYVEPKINLEENDLDHVRSQRAAAGTSGREAKQLEKQIEQQEALLSELRDFRDKLRRAADLGLEPDLDDGVVLNIAPLWELVPWSEAKKYWQELLEGKYDWSSISKQLRAKGLVK